MFGNTIEIIRNIMEFELITNESRADKIVSKPNFNNIIFYGDNIVGFEL